MGFDDGIGQKEDADVAALVNVGDAAVGVFVQRDFVFVDGLAQIAQAGYGLDLVGLVLEQKGQVLLEILVNQGRKALVGAEKFALALLSSMISMRAPPLLRANGFCVTIGSTSGAAGCGAVI